MAKRSMFGFLLVALNLRIAIAAVSPLLDDLRSAEHLSSGAAGLLTTVPVICFGAFAFVTPRLAHRLGLHRLLGASMIVLAAGILLRLAPGVAALYGGTLLIGASIAVANVVMPALIKRDFAGRVAAVTALYSTALFVGAALSAGLTVPLRDATGLDGRGALALWVVPAVLGAIAWAPQMRGADAQSAPPSLRRLWRDRVAWAVTGFMGLQSLQYYAMLAWLPTLLRDHGMGKAEAGWMLSYTSAPGIAAALGLPLVERRLRHRAVLPIAAALLYALAYLGLLIAPLSGGYLWMTLLGLGQGASISLAFGYIVARSPDAHHAGQLSTMAQSTGYLLACLGPLGVGVLHAGDGWVAPVVALLALLVVQVVAGVQASRDRHILAA